MTKHRILCAAIVLALSLGWAAAQCNEPMDAAVRNMTTVGYALGNAWLCPTENNSGSPYCGITYNFYSSHTSSNGDINKAVDGNPIYVFEGMGSYRTDVDNSQNYYGALHACGLPMYVIWDGELDSDTGDHKGFYGAQGQDIFQGELGNIFTACGGTTRSVSCFPTLTGNQAPDVSDTPQGTLLSQGGMEPIPIARVDSYDRISGDIVLSWDEPTNYRTEEGTQSPIVGMEIYVVEDSGVLDSRAVRSSDVDSGARFVGRVLLPSLNITLNDGSSAECSGGPPPDHCIEPGTGSFVPVTKVAYAANAGVGDPIVFDSYSANGPVLLVNTALFTEVVNFQALSLGKARGLTSFELSWDTVAEDSLVGFVVKRASSISGDFTPITGLIEPRGGGEGAHYAVTDTFRAKGGREFFYTLEVYDSDQDATPQVVGPIRAVTERKPGEVEH